MTEIREGTLVRTGDSVEDYDHCTNKMAIIRGVVDRRGITGEDTPERYTYLYRATMLDSGEKVELWREEFEPAEGDANHG